MSGLLVITPTLGKSRWLDETVSSVDGLSCACRHVLVCPEEARAALEKQFPRTQVLAEPRCGMYAAINAGIANSSDWDAFTYLNDDDVLCEEGTVAVAQLLARDSETDVVYGNVGLIDADGARLGWLPVAHHPEDLAGLLARGIVPLAQPGTWLRSTVLKRLAGFDENFRLAGDLDLFSRALAGGSRFGYVSTEVARFRLHAGQLSKDEAAGEHEKGRALLRWAKAPSPLSALLRFRRDNFSVYLDRIRRHGFVSMRSLYRK